MISTSRLAAITLAISSLPLALHAADSTLDSAFVTTISPGLTPDGYVPPPASPNWLGGTGAVNAVALQSDGKIIAGGNLSRYQAPPAGSPRSSLKRLNPDGTLDTAFGALAATLADTQGDTEVNKILTVAGDKLYVGGVFTSYQGTNRSGIMRLNADGSLDTAFNAIGISNSSAFSVRYVLALAEQPDDKLLVGGSYNRANGVFRPGLARFNPDGTLDTAFNPFPALPSDSGTQDIAVLPNGQILVAGGKPRPGGGGTPLLVRLNSDGSLDASLAPSFADEFGDIDEMIALPDGRIVIGGDFTFLPSGTSYNIACLLPDGSLDTTFMNNLGSGPNGWAGGEVALQPDGTIFVGGIFKSWNGQPRASIARVNLDGTLDPSFAPAPYINDNSYTTHFYSFAFQPDGKLVAGGWFPRVSDPAVETYNLTRFVNEYSPASPGTLRLVSTDVSVGENQPSATLQVSRYAGTTGAVSIDFTTLTSGANGNATAGLDFTQASGSLSWASGESGVKSITVPLLADATADGAKTFTVQLSNPTGSPFLPTPTSRTTVTILDADALPAITTQPASVSLEQGARFSLSVRYDSVLAATVQWQRDPDGGGPLPFADIPGATATATVYTVATADAVTHSGTYRAVITNPNGTTPTNAVEVAISTPTGSLVSTTSTFAPNATLLSAALDALQRPLVLVAGNSFAVPATFATLQRLTFTPGNPAAFAPDAAFTAPSFTLVQGSPATTTSGSPTAVLPLPDGKTLVAGYFNRANGVARPGVARFLADGTLDSTFNPTLPTPLNGLTSAVTALTLGQNGQFYLGLGYGNSLGKLVLRYNSDGTEDTAYNAQLPAFGNTSNAATFTLREGLDGSLYVAHRIGSPLSYPVWRLHPSGARDTTFADPGANFDVFSIDFLPDGRVALGGRFTSFSTAPGVSLWRVALVDSTGKIDPTFMRNPGLDAAVNVVRYTDGRLLVGGEFSLVNSFAQRGLTRLNLDGTRDTTFAVGVGASARVTAALFTGPGDILIAGDFITFNGVARNRLALLMGNPLLGAIGFNPARLTRLDSSGSATLTLRRYGPASEQVSVRWTTAASDPAYSDISATAGADYTAATGIVYWPAGDSADKSITVQILGDTVLEPTERFRVVLSEPSGPINPAAGATVELLDANTPVTFTSQPTGPSGGLANVGSAFTLSAIISSPTPVTYQWFLNGRALVGATAASLTRNPVTSTDAGLYTLVATNAAGAFTTTPVNVIVPPQPGRPVTSQPTTGRPQFDSNNGPTSALALPDGGVLLGGIFTANAPLNRNQAYLLRIRPNGTTDTTFTVALNAAVVALRAQPDGKILVLGNFTTVNTAAQRYLIRLNSDLSLDTTFNTTTAAAFTSTAVPLNASALNFALDATGRIYLGFATGSGGFVRRLDSTGNLDSAYLLGTSSGAPFALALDSADRLLVGGSFTNTSPVVTIGGTPTTSPARPRLARFDSTGVLDATFVPALGSNSVRDLFVLPATGRIFAGLDFSPGLVEVLASGAGTVYNLGNNTSVSETTLSPDGRPTLVRNTSGATAVQRFIPAASPGGSATTDTTYTTGTGPNGNVNTLAYRPDGALWVAGDFTNFDGVTTASVALLQASAGDPAIVNPPVRTDANIGTTARLAVGAIGTGLTYQWSKNGTLLSDDARISGTTTAILTITGLLATDDDTYTVAVTGGTPSTTVTSVPAKLNVLAAPAVVTSPLLTSPVFGSTITLSAEVLAATPATYVWTRNGVPLINGGRYSGTSTSTLVITGANTSDNGAYTLTVTNTLGTASTTPATIAAAQVATDRDPATTALSATSRAYTFVHLPDGRTLVGSQGTVTGAASTSSTTKLSIIETDGRVTPSALGIFNSQVSRLVHQPNGKILVLGGFTAIGANSGTGYSRFVRLNADLTRDSTFAPYTSAGDPSRAVVDAQGRIYLAGGFLDYDGRAGYNYFVRLQPDGSLDPSFNLNLTNSVLDLALQTDGKILIAGSFNTYGPAGSTTPAKGLLRLNADGTVDTSFTSAAIPPSATSQNINAIALDSQGRIAVAYFYYNGAFGYGVNRLLPTGALDPAFNFGETITQSPTLLVSVAGDQLLVGGLPANPNNGLVRLNSDGSRDTAFATALGTGFGGATTLRAIVPDARGRLWIGGDFGTFKGASAIGIVVLQGEASPLAFAGQPFSQVRDIGTTATFTAAATGNNGFTYQWLRNGLPLADGGRISGSTTATLTITGLQISDATGYSVVVTSPSATLTSNTAQLTVLTTPEILATPASLTVELGGTATFTGSARGAGTLSYQWLLNGTSLTNGTSGGVTIAGATTPSLTVTGVNFDTDGSYRLRVTNTLGQTTTAAAVLTVDRRPGSLAAGISQPTPSGAVLAILRLADGSMLVGGQFDSITINGVVNNRSRLARFLANGTLDPAFTPTFNGDVRALAQDSSGRIFVGGSFNGTTTVGGVTATRIRVARLTSALVLDTAFDTSTAGPNDQINALAPTEDGGIYVGGDFSFNRVGTAVVNRVARLSSTGAHDPAFANLAFPVNNVVKALLRRPDGKLYVGGTFGNTLLTDTGAQDTAFGGVTSGQAFLLRADGNLVVAGGNPYYSIVNGNTGVALKNYVTGHSLAVSSVAQQADGKLLSGSRGVLKRTNPATDLDDTGFVGGDNYIYALAVDGAGRIWAGGAFSTFAGVARPRLAILNGGEFESQSGPLTPQVITFAPLADKNTLDAPFALAASSDSGLPVSYSISGPATLAGSTVTLTGATGTVTLTATQAGNATTAAATQIVRTFAVIDSLASFLTNAGVPANLRGPNDDPDFDGLSNLLEYALDLNPNGTGGSFTGTLPSYVQSPAQLSYTYRRVRNDVTYVVETSPTLIGGTWTSVGVTQGTPVGDGTTTASIPVTPGSKFLRLSVTR